MQVTSQDGETAWATMTLRVVAKGTPRDQIEGGFTVHAKPMMANVGEVIQFTGICEFEGQVNGYMDFGNSKSAQV